MPFLRAVASSQFQTIIAKQVYKFLVTKFSCFFSPQENVDFHLKTPIFKLWKSKYFKHYANQ